LVITGKPHVEEAGGGAADETCGYIDGSEKGRLGPRTYFQPFGDPQPLASPPAWRRMPGKEPVCWRPGKAFAERELVKRTMTYRGRLLVKCVLTNLRFNWSNAQRHNRNGYWSSVPREAVPIRPRLESEWGLKLHSSVGWWWPQYMTASPCGRRKCPGFDAGALQADDASLLA
jgi:hypothetical protein